MSEEIRCRVVKILSDRELVLDAGSESGVEEDMRFRIVGSLPIEHLEHEGILDVIEVTKVSVRVVDVRDHVCVARTYKTEGGRPIVGAFLNSSFLGSVEKIEYDASDEQVTYDKTVKRGDSAVSIAKSKDRE